MIKFSPSANRSLQLEQLINLMMEPDPNSRPSADEILLHPRLQSIMISLKDSASSSMKLVDPLRAATNKRNINLS